MSHFMHGIEPSLGENPSFPSQQWQKHPPLSHPSFPSMHLEQNTTSYPALSVSTDLLRADHSRSCWQCSPEEVPVLLRDPDSPLLGSPGLAATCHHGGKSSWPIPHHISQNQQISKLPHRDRHLKLLLSLTRIMEVTSESLAATLPHNSSTAFPNSKLRCFNYIMTELTSVKECSKKSL